DNSETNISHVFDRVLQASQYFYGINKGPIHINIPVREPLMPDVSRTDLFYRTQQLENSVTFNTDIEPLVGNGLVIIGETDDNLDDFDFTQYKNLTFIMDPRIGKRTELSHVVTTHDLIFRIGEAVTSKSTNQFLKRTTLPQILISEFNDVKTFPKIPNKVYVGNVKETLKSLFIESDYSDNVLYNLDNKIKSLIEDTM